MLTLLSNGCRKWYWTRLWQQW